MIALLLLVLTGLLALLGVLAVMVSPYFFSGMTLVFVVTAYAAVKATLPARDKNASSAEAGRQQAKHPVDVR